MSRVRVTVSRSVTYAAGPFDWEVNFPGAGYMAAPSWIEQDVYFPPPGKGVEPALLAESLGERWGQGVWFVEEIAAGLYRFEVEPVPVTVYGVDGEAHQHLVGRVVV